MKRFLSVIAAGLLMLCGCTTAQTPPEAAAVTTQETDSTPAENGTPEISVLRAFLRGEPAELNAADYDLDGNGRLDARDMTLLKRRLLPDAPDEAPDEAPEILVAYFSCTSNTAGIAQTIANGLHADIYEILPAVPYTADDLDYNSDCRANREQKDDKARPELAGSIDISAYDTILLGYPIWWGQAPKIMYTFMENSDFTGKTIVPFCTSGSSSIGTSAKNLSAAAPGADWLDGRRFAGGAKESEIMAWVDSLGLTKQSEEQIMYIAIGDTRLTADLADNSSAEALAALLREAPLTIDMHDYGNFEKVGSLGTTLPRNDEPITTVPGDIILYQGNSITIYYDENTWNFTRIGRLRDVTQAELKTLLGDGNVTVTFSLE